MESYVQMDRLSTWPEVCCALSFQSQRVANLDCTCDGDCASEPEFSDPVSILAKEVAWLALATEALAPTSN
jgi:hypothetical protein